MATQTVSAQGQDIPSGPGPGEVRTGRRAKDPTVLQIEAVECGAACLAMVLAARKRWVPLDEIRVACGVSRDGVSAVGLGKAAVAYGLNPHGIRGGIEQLQGVKMPAIIWWRHKHFVVLEGAKRGKYWINDPAAGHRRVDAVEFEDSYSGVAITFTQRDDFKQAGQRFNVLPSLVRRLRHSRDGVLMIVLAGLLALIPALLIPVAAQIFVDDVLGNADAGLVPTLVFGLIVVAVASVTLNQLQSKALVRLQTKLSLVGTWQLLEHLLRMPMAFFWQRSVGDLSTRMTYPPQVAQVLANQVGAALVGGLTIIAYGVLMIIYSWQLALVVLGLAVLNAVALRWLIRNQRSQQQKLTRELSQVQGVTVRMAQTMETIKASGSEDAAFLKWASSQIRAVNAQASMSWTSALIASLPTLIGALTAAAILVLGGYQIIQGNASIGVLVAFQVMAPAVAAPLAQLSGTASQLQIQTAAVERIDDVMAQRVDPRFAQPRPQLSKSDASRLSGHIEFRNVTFGYGRNLAPIIKDFNLELQPGQRVALVGRSGAGKSTIANLAAGLLNAWSGEVRYDGRLLSEIPYGLLETSVGKVDQASFLFAATVRENVTLWDSTVPTTVVEQALSDANLLDDVLRRPGGLNAAVREAGNNFSGGQQQRLEIARALISNPAVLILDEATSALDAISEQIVDLALRARGCGALIVAHRLSTIRNCDEIIVLDQGGVIAERGTHRELMSSGSLYSQLARDAGKGDDVGV